jgi:hypothetical protein
MNKGTPASSQIIWLEQRVQEQADRIEQLQALLDQRDVFIVENGLWPKFVATAALGEKNDG